MPYTQYYGRDDGSIPSDEAATCRLQQEDFKEELAKDNVIFRIPTPVFGAGLVEKIEDQAIKDNKKAAAELMAELHIKGISGKLPAIVDDHIGRFGWKAQNQSLRTFSAEAYNVEMGITNESFQ